MFNVLLDELERVKKKGNQPILIIDEIQTLEDIYINGDRKLLKEFLNFCVRLTKETHISHIVILSLNTIFIDRIYNDAKLKKTSNFYKIDHIERGVVEEWLSREGFKKEEVELIWDYFGGCIPDIQRMMRERKEAENLKEYLKKQAYLAESEIIDLMRKMDKDKRSRFKEIVKVIVKKGYFEASEDDDVKLDEVISYFSKKEILFFDPLERKVTGNSRIYEKGFERLLN